MADPLSIAASVAGLLATAAKICSVLHDFVRGVIDAPQSARAALATVTGVRAALDMVSGLIYSLASLPSRRRALVRLDHLAITFSSCVLTLSELESLVTFKDGVIHRLKWLWAEKKVEKLLPRLESQKTSLALMVGVLRCQSEIEALESRDKLNAAIEQILQRDDDFAARVQKLDERHLVGDSSVRFHDDESVVRRVSTMTVTATGERGLLSGSGSGLESTASPPDSSRLDSQASEINRRDFEVALEGSRVYTRVESNTSDASFTTSAVRSHAWSMLSLADISIVAVFRLPLTLDDINKCGLGLTFATLFQGQAISASTSHLTGQDHQKSASAAPVAGIIKRETHVPVPGSYVNAILRESCSSTRLVIVGNKEANKTTTLNTSEASGPPKSWGI